ncbi:hypothetical protein GCM10011506_34630 [Marivirga lumbricoides]|uniref:Phosphoribosylpyrophosphate synthetase n=1 Tax=Marivirga lumbricoides TaxID=1046115 RepID=A0A2T4DVP6_9BACT|nr:hypothetical protein C9994_00710 [Marivirga lumbricoides]GGC46087.1 hypothetical protein GCM10011506_34630 [Marivirga lumbricoides]
MSDLDKNSKSGLASMSKMKTITQRLEELKSEGYTEDFEFVNGKLTSDNSKFSAGQVEIVNEFRFEGASNPDDLSILYQIKAEDGTKGTIVDGYGPSANAELAQFLMEVEKS